MTVQSIADAKAQARGLRQALAEVGRPVSHGQALELVARQNGARDWNTLHAGLGNGKLPPLQLEQPVTGRYLGQRFRGRIVSLSKAGGGYALSIQLDQPVDTVRFDSFSNLRHQIRGVIDRDGRSHSRTSDGVPHLILDQV